MSCESSWTTQYVCEAVTACEKLLVQAFGEAALYNLTCGDNSGPYGDWWSIDYLCQNSSTISSDGVALQDNSLSTRLLSNTHCHAYLEGE